jgi:hypothetical protein
MLVLLEQKPLGKLAKLAPFFVLRRLSSSNSTEDLNIPDVRICPLLVRTMY